MGRVPLAVREYVIRRSHRCTRRGVALRSLRAHAVAVPFCLGAIRNAHRGGLRLAVFAFRTCVSSHVIQPERRKKAAPLSATGPSCHAFALPPLRLCRALGVALPTERTTYARQYILICAYWWRHMAAAYVPGVARSPHSARARNRRTHTAHIAFACTRFHLHSLSLSLASRTIHHSLYAAFRFKMCQIASWYSCALARLCLYASRHVKKAQKFYSVYKGCLHRSFMLSALERRREAFIVWRWQ